MTKRNTYIILLLSFITIVAITSLLYTTFINAYQIESKEFRYLYNNSLYESYVACVGDGVFYNGAANLVDSLSTRLKEDLKELPKPLQKKAKEQYLTDLKHVLNENNTLDLLWEDYCLRNGLDWRFNYAILLHHIGILREDGKELVIYDKKPADPSVRLLGTLKNFNDDNYLMYTKAKIQDKYLIVYSLYVDTPARNRLILSGMKGVIGLALLTVSSIIVVLLYVLQNWLLQKRLSDMQRNFISNVTHELKTPLTTIAIANKSLQKENTLANPVLMNGMLEVIDRQSKRLQRLITQVLDLSIWEKEAFSLETENLSLHQLIKTIVYDFDLKQQDKKVLVSCDLNAVNDWVKVDAFHFTTAFNNLLDNAVKYSKDEVEIKIASANPSPNNIVLTISDNGIGMKQQTIHFIFDKFYRAQAGNIHNVKGLGLGLYYVKKSIEAHGGTIKVKSKLGKGSTFSIGMDCQVVPAELEEVLISTEKY